LQLPAGGDIHFRTENQLCWTPWFVGLLLQAGVN
jgi:hypothetical protein